MIHLLISLFLLISSSSIHCLIINMTQIEFPNFNLIMMGDFYNDDLIAYDHQDITFMQQILKRLSTLPILTTCIYNNSNTHNEAALNVSKGIYQDLPETRTLQKYVDLFAHEHQQFNNMHFKTVNNTINGILELTDSIKLIEDSFLWIMKRNNLNGINDDEKDAFFNKVWAKVYHIQSSDPMPSYIALDNTFTQIKTFVQQLGFLKNQAAAPEYAILDGYEKDIIKNYIALNKSLKKANPKLPSHLGLLDSINKNQAHYTSFIDLKKSIQALHFSLVAADLLMCILKNENSAKTILIFNEHIFTSTLTKVLEELYPTHPIKKYGSYVQRSETTLVSTDTLFSANYLQQIFDSVINHNYCNNCYKSQKSDGKCLDHCAACKKIYYCSRECQSKDWSKHKATCKKAE